MMIAITPPKKVTHRAIALVILTWVPLLFTQENDLSIHVRFLICLPLLILAETLVQAQLTTTTGHLLRSDILIGEARNRILSTLQVLQDLHNSKWAYGVLFIIAIIFMLGRIQVHSFKPQTGLWLHLVSLPIFQFVLLRWTYNCLLWTGFLWKLARSKLQLAPIHPDHNAGLGFLWRGQAPFLIITIALTTVLAADLYPTFEFQTEYLHRITRYLLGIFAINLALFAGPLLLFTPKLLLAKQKALIQYDELSDDYVTRFQNKWIEHRKAEEPLLLGTTDIQSLADLTHSYSHLETMSIFLWNKKMFIAFAVATALPWIPLFIKVIPLPELLDLVRKAISF